MSNGEALTAIEDNMTSAQAELAKLHLEEAGIPAFLDGENAGAMLGLAEQVRLLVPTDLVEKASQELATRRQSIPLETNVCLACGQLMAEDQSRCGSCGWSFQDGAAEAGESDVVAP